MPADVVIPDAEAFRKWLEASLRRLEVSAHSLGKKAGVPKNAARKFIAREHTDLRLNTANALIIGVHIEAKKRGIELPLLPDIFKAIDNYESTK